MNNEKQPKWSGKTQPNGRQPDHKNQSGPPDKSSQVSEEERLPAKVVAAIQESNRRDLAVPDAVRAAVFQDAADVLKRRKNNVAKSKPVWSRRSWMGISAGVLASALLVAVLIPTVWMPDRPLGVNSAERAGMEMADAGDESLPSIMRSERVLAADPSAKDIDGNGQVDILDAFLLARSIENNQPDDQFEIARLDQNGDGVINSDDVNSIAMSVVML